MNLFRKLFSLVRNLPLLVLTFVFRSPDQVKHQVPYISQFANPAWAEMVIKSDQPLAKDMLWEESGAKTIEDYERWALTTCGMACTAMILRFFNKGDYKTISLAKDASNVGVYTKGEDGEISAMQYRPYTKWVKKFGVKAKIHHDLSFRSICYLLSQNQLLIASVNPNIRDYDTAPKTQVGGHLVLVTGYNKKDRMITIHNPSGFENNNTQVNHTLRVQDFYIYFAGRGIAVRSK